MKPYADYLICLGCSEAGRDVKEGLCHDVGDGEIAEANETLAPTTLRVNIF